MRVLIVASTIAAATVGCSLRFASRETPIASSTVASTETDTTPPPPIVQVRNWRGAALVSVLAWDSDDRGIGLSTSIDQRGVLHGGLRAGDHRLYVDAFYAWSMGGFRYAAVMPDTVLLPTGVRSDPYACFYNHKNCSALTTANVRLADSVLRTNRDSLVVTFVGGAYRPWTVTLRRELIADYLHAVDSVVAEKRRVASR